MRKEYKPISDLSAVLKGSTLRYDLYFLGERREIEIGFKKETLSEEDIGLLESLAKRGKIVLKLEDLPKSIRKENE